MVGLVRIITDLLGHSDDGTERRLIAAARTGDTSALARLGALHATTDPDQAEWWYRRGAQAGDRESMEALSMLMAARGRTEEATAWWHHARGAADT